jgi:hypothetical protein
VGIRELVVDDLDEAQPSQTTGTSDRSSRKTTATIHSPVVRAFRPLGGIGDHLQGRWAPSGARWTRRARSRRRAEQHEGADEESTLVAVGSPPTRDRGRRAAPTFADLDRMVRIAVD